MPNFIQAHSFLGWKIGEVQKEVLCGGKEEIDIKGLVQSLGGMWIQVGGEKSQCFLLGSVGVMDLPEVR